MVKSSPAQPASSTALSRTATAPVSGSVKSAQAAAAAITPYGPVSRASTNADAFSASASTASSSSSGRIINCRVTFLDDTHAIFRVPVKAKGGVLLKQVFKHLRVLEPEYFGLQYRDAGEVYYWVDSEKPLNRHPGLTIPTSDVPANFVFCVKFYSSDPAYLEDEFTRYLFVLQIRRDLARGQLVCQDHTAALLAAYVVQAEEGDFNRDNYRDYTYLLKYRFHPRQDVNFLRMVMENHIELQGQNPAEADLNYLEIARRCEMYGIRLHDATDHEGVALQLAVSHLGVNVFQSFQKVNLFSWAKIRKLSFKRRKFLIKLHPETYQGYYKDTVEFLFDSRNSCKGFWKQCIEHHVFFRGRTNEQNVTRSRSSRMFQYGSHFRFTGRTQRQVVECMKETLTKRSVSASATPNRAHQMSSAATRQASVGGGGGHTLPSSKSYTATLTATPLLPIAQMRRSNLPNRFNTTGGSRIVRNHGNGKVNAGGVETEDKTAAAPSVTTETQLASAMELAQNQQPPIDIKTSTSTSTFSPPSQLQHSTEGRAAVHVRAVPPSTLSTTSSSGTDRSQTLPRTVPALGLAENVNLQTAPNPNAVQDDTNEAEDADKTPTQQRRSSAAVLRQQQQQTQSAETSSGSQTSSTASTLSKKSLKNNAAEKQKQSLPSPLSTSINGHDVLHQNDQQLVSLDHTEHQQRPERDSSIDAISPSTASDNATPTAASVNRHHATATAPIMRESDFIEEYVMPIPPPPAATSAHERHDEEEEAAEEEQDSLTGMNMTEEVPYVLYRRKIKWDKFLTYPPPVAPHQQQDQILFSPDEFEQQHHRSAHELAQQALPQATALSPYTTYTRYIDQQNQTPTKNAAASARDAENEDETRIHYADQAAFSSGEGGASVITDVHIEQQRLLPVSLPVLLTSGQQHNKTTPHRTPTPIQHHQQPSVVRSLHEQQREDMASSNEAILAAMPSTKLRVLDYVAVNRNRLPPVSMCYSYEDDSVSIDSLQRQLFESVKRKQAARIRDQQQVATHSITSVPQSTESMRRPSREDTKVGAAAPLEQQGASLQWLREQQQQQNQQQQQPRRQRSHSTDSVASTASSASRTSSSASEASYNTTSVDEHDFDGEDLRPRAAKTNRSSRSSAKNKSKVAKEQQILYVAPKHKQQLGINDENLAYADESATTITDSSNKVTNTPAAAPQGSNSSDDQYYKAVRQRSVQQAATDTAAPYYYPIDPDDLIVPPPPPPLSATTKDELLYNYDEDPARAYLLAQQQRRSRSLNAPRTASMEASDLPVVTQQLLANDDTSTAAALLASQQQRRPSYDMAVTTGRMLANGGHGLKSGSVDKTAVVDGTGALAFNKTRTRVAGSRASAIGVVSSNTLGATGGQPLGSQPPQQPLNAMSTTLHVYPSFDDSGKPVGSQHPHPHHHQTRANANGGNNNRQYQQQYFDAVLLPPRPPGVGGGAAYSSSSTTHTGNSAHNDFSESELNAFVEMSYQDLQSTVRDYSLSSDRFTSSEGISTASSPSGTSSPMTAHRRDDFIYPSSHAAHPPGRAHAPLGQNHQAHLNHPSYRTAASGSHSQQQQQKNVRPQQQLPVQIVTTTTTTDETSTSPVSARAAHSGQQTQQRSGKLPTRHINSHVAAANQQQRPNVAVETTTTTSHTEASTTATGSDANGSSCSSSTSYTSSSPSATSSVSSTASSARRRTAEESSSPAAQQQQQLLENSAVPNLKLDTILIAPTTTTIRQTSDAENPENKVPFSRHKDSKKVTKLAAASKPVPAPKPIQLTGQRASIKEEYSFSPPPPPLPELYNIPPQTLQTTDNESNNKDTRPAPTAAAAGGSSYMDEWRAKMRELEQLTGVTSPSSDSSSSSTGGGVTDQLSPTDTQTREDAQQPMPIIPPPAEFGNGTVSNTVEDEHERRLLADIHGAGGVSYGTTGGRLFELSTPRSSLTPPLPPSAARQQAQLAPSAFRGLREDSTLESDELTHSSRL